MNESNLKHGTSEETEQEYALRMAEYYQSEHFRREQFIDRFYGDMKNKRTLHITLHNKSGANLPYNIYYKNEQEAFIEIALAGYKMNDLRIDVKSDFLSIYTTYNSSGLNQPEQKEFLHYNANGFGGDRLTHDQSFYIYRGITQRAFSMDFFIPTNHVEASPMMDNGILRIRFNLNEISDERKTFRLTNTGIEDANRPDSPKTYKKGNLY